MRQPAKVELRTVVRAEDIGTVREIVTSTGFFSDAEIAVAVELIEDRVSRGERSDYRFLFAEQNGRTSGYACYGPIACTTGSFDLYWIAVHPSVQGAGVGKKLLAAAEALIAGESGRHVYVETSSRVQYDPTRIFYEHNRYRLAAVLPDFYAPGDDKVIYVKELGSRE
jgi:GNAT superfamily N-acetyltransferase